MCKLENIIEKCKKGDPGAAEQLYKMFAARMFSICIRYSRNRNEAEDNLQDGFIKVFHSIGQYSGKGSFEGWMKRVFVTTALEKYRKEQAFRYTEELTEATLYLEAEETITVPEEVLSRFVEELPEKYRLVFNLYAIEEMTHKDIAALAGISEGTSKSNLARARDILKKKVKEYLEHES